MAARPRTSSARSCTRTGHSCTRRRRAAATGSAWTEDGEAATGATTKKGKKKGKKGKKWDTQLGVDVNDVKAVQDLIAKEVGS